MHRMSGETGGRVFKVDRKNTLDDIFKDLQDEMRSQYSIGYTSPHAEKDGSYHKIEIRTSNKDYKVQARKGYYAIPQDNKSCDLRLREMSLDHICETSPQLVKKRVARIASASDAIHNPISGSHIGRALVEENRPVSMHQHENRIERLQRPHRPLQLRFGIADRRQEKPSVRTKPIICPKSRKNTPSAARNQHSPDSEQKLRDDQQPAATAPTTAARGAQTATRA